MTRASAPGKLVLCGEYAVLNGAPAIAAAINRRAEVTVENREAVDSRVTAPGYLPGSYDFHFVDDSIEWREPSPPDGSMRLLEAVIQTGLTRGGDPPGSLTLELDTRAFVSASGDRKLGIGSSAALVAALTAALSGKTATAMLLQRAMAAHRRFQEGRGSGVDVAASCTGGLICYTVNEQPVPVVWPDGLQMAVLASRRPASTREAIDRYLREPLAEAEDGLAAAASDAADAWMHADAQTVLNATCRFAGTLHALDQRCGLGIFAAGHNELYRVAGKQAGIVYKPSGAGGGDIGVAFSLSERALRDFCSIAAETGFKRIDLAVDTLGASRDDDE